MAGFASVSKCGGGPKVHLTAIEQLQIAKTLPAAKSNHQGNTRLHSAARDGVLRTPSRKKRIHCRRSFLDSTAKYAADRLQGSHQSAYKSPGGESDATLSLGGLQLAESTEHFSTVRQAMREFESTLRDIHYDSAEEDDGQ